MQTLEHKEIFDFSQGVYYSQPEFGASLPGTAKEAFGLWKRGEEWSSDRGDTSIGPSGSPSYLQNLNGVITGGVTSIGNIASLFNTFWAAGNGDIVENGVDTTYNVTNNLTVKVGGIYLPAGVAQPPAPTFTVPGGATTSTKFNGTYAVALVGVRPLTGAVSNVSLRSAVISVKNKMGTIGFPTGAAIPAGTTHWLVYGTLRGHGSQGNLYKVTTIAPVAVGTATLEVHWVDGELGDLAPITNDPPPACTHCFPIGSVMCVATAGGMVYPSKPGQPESYDLSLAVRLPSGEAPVGVTARGSDGGVFIGTRNSISLIVATNSEFAPIFPRGVFESVGIANGNAMCWVFDTLYVFSATGTLCRTHGGSTPDTSFAAPYQQYFRDNGFTGSNTHLIHDKRNGALLVCSGTKAVPFMLDTEQWSGVITLPAAARAGIALNDDGLVDCAGTMYTLDTASGSPRGGWNIRSPYLPVAPPQFAFHKKKFREYRGAGTGSQTHDFLKNQAGTSIGSPFPFTFTGPHGTNFIRLIVNGIDSLAFKASGTAGNQKVQASYCETTVEVAHVA